jgi:abequosyltransferase
MSGAQRTLAICIPTHEGRAPCLRQLFESISRQIPPGSERQIEICISDNASADGTAALITELRSTIGVPVRYFRFERDMRGVRNFLNVVDMAEADYCWLVGSDDLVAPGGIERVLAALDRCPMIEGLSMNKLNFDRLVQTSLGPDHALVLPSRPASSRMLTGLEEIASNLALGMAFMSAHVFRRSAWQKVVREVGVDRLGAMRHFPHTYIYLRIASGAGAWYWLGEYCVIQRMDNFSILEENRRLQSAYFAEVTDDMEKAWRATLPADLVRRDLMPRLFYLYWNPIAVFLNLTDPRVTSEDQRQMRTDCVRRFRAYPMFWLTTYPVLWVPVRVCRLIYGAGRAVNRVLPIGGAAQRLFVWCGAMISRARRSRSGGA